MANIDLQDVRRSSRKQTNTILHLDYSKINVIKIKMVLVIIIKKEEAK